MPALPPDDMRQLRQTAFAARHPVDAMIARWETIGGDASRLAAIAELGEPAATGEGRDFLAALEGASDWQRELAWQGIEDITAMLKAGLTALEVLAGRGINARIPALALWREVDTAQRSLLAMLGSTDLCEKPSAATA